MCAADAEDVGEASAFGSLGALAPSWWEPAEGGEAEPWLEPDEAFDRFSDWVSDRGIEFWPHQEEALMSLMVGNHVILGTPTGSGKSLVALGLHFMALASGKRSYYTAPIKALVNEKFFDLVEVFGRDNVGMITGDSHINADASGDLLHGGKFSRTKRCARVKTPTSVASRWMSSITSEM